MRMTIRITLSMMNAVESALDEISNKYRGTEYYNDMVLCRRQMMNTHTILHQILDRMMDSGIGD